MQAWTVLARRAMHDAGSADPWLALLVIVGLLAVAALVILLAYYAMTPCPACQRRGTLRWRYERVNGGPDRRYRDNFRYCSACRAGWREDPT